MTNEQIAEMVRNSKTYTDRFLASIVETQKIVHDGPNRFTSVEQVKSARAHLEKLKAVLLLAFPAAA